MLNTSYIHANNHDKSYDIRACRVSYGKHPYNGKHNKCDLFSYWQEM